MKVRELLRLLLWPLIILCLLVIAQAFFAYYTQGTSKLLDYLNAIIDLREERTIGTWFESILFVIAGLSFFLVSRHPALPKPGKALLVLMALGFCFLSADEALSLHEFMGYELEQATGIVKDTRLDQRGYSWVLLYAPIAVVIAGLLFSFYRRMIKAAASKAPGICFLLAWVAVGLVVLCEAVDGLSILERADLSILPCFEESLELVFIMLFYTANLLIAEKADL
ncbi:MAG: hypothetical protein HOO88_05620 [Kiritimatiellaceae bacterium]|nr:hypothetical protein [Kiritimatiellaceae bacterium]